jgi:hypothetical protein
MDLQETGLGRGKGMSWIDLVQDRDEWCSCEHSNEPSSSTKYREFLD